MNRRSFVSVLFASAAGGAQIVTGPPSIQGRAAVSAGVEFRGGTIRTGNQAAPIDQKVAALLAERIRGASSVPVTLQGESGQPGGGTGELTILLGEPAHHARIS